MGLLMRPQAYFEAWTYAKSHLPSSVAETETETQKALRKFIDNWTCEEFVGFVDDCRDVVDELELGKDPEMAERCEQVSFLSTCVPAVLGSLLMSPREWSGLLTL